MWRNEEKFECVEKWSLLSMCAFWMRFRKKEEICVNWEWGGERKYMAFKINVCYFFTPQTAMVLNAHQLSHCLEKTQLRCVRAPPHKLNAQSVVRVTPHKLYTNRDTNNFWHKSWENTISHCMGLPLAKSNITVWLGLSLAKLYPLIAQIIWIDFCFPPQVLQ